MQQVSEPTPIYLGSRGEPFKALIVSLLKRGKLKPKYIELLTDADAMAQYGIAFTSKTADNTKNYEMYEQLGDVTANKFIVWYMYRRFPQLKCAFGVRVVARLRINYGAKISFAPIAEKLGFWQFISADEEERYHKKKKLLEDCLEAFCGCTESFLDSKIKVGVGNAIVYDILSSIFNEMQISLKYEDLYDSKTRLKQLAESSVFPQGKTIVYFYDDQDRPVKSTVFLLDKQEKRQLTGEFLPRKHWIVLGVGTAAIKIDSEQRAASVALENLKRADVFVKAPEEYDLFCSRGDMLK